MECTGLPNFWTGLIKEFMGVIPAKVTSDDFKDLGHVFSLVGGFQGELQRNDHLIIGAFLFNVNIKVRRK